MVYADILRRASLVMRALEKDGDFRLCEGKTFAECFTEENGVLMFWFIEKITGTCHAVKETDMPGIFDYEKENFEMDNKSEPEEKSL